MMQLTKEEAIALHDGETWKGLTDVQRAALQLAQDKLCMPFSVFHQSIIIALGRPVWSHEFADPKLLAEELLFRMRATSMEEILGDLPVRLTGILHGASR